MTLYANRNNIKPMFFGIAFMMMILFCLRRAILTLQCVNFGHFTSSCSSTHSTFSFFSIWISQVIAFMGSDLNSLTFFALFVSFLIGFEICTFFLIAFLGSFAIFCLLIFFAIFQPTNFALIKMAIFTASIYMKVSKRIRIFAFGSSFCYDWLRHGFLLTRKLCLEPIAGYMPAVGSFYYIANRRSCK